MSIKIKHTFFMSKTISWNSFFPSSISFVIALQWQRFSISKFLITDRQSEATHKQLRSRAKARASLHARASSVAGSDRPRIVTDEAPWNLPSGVLQTAAMAPPAPDREMAASTLILKQPLGGGNQHGTYALDRRTVIICAVPAPSSEATSVIERSSRKR